MSINLSDLPNSPGVYLFKDDQGQTIYVGKAVNLTRRIRQYFAPANSGQKSALLKQNIVSVDTIKTAGEFDALLLEASLIRKYKPKYNSIAKDDKSPLYIAMTLSEEYPRPLYIRGKELASYKTRSKDRIFGPFQSARVARSIMKDLRRSIPFCTQKQRNGTPCFYTHIGLCSPCPSYISGLVDDAQKKLQKTKYRANMFRLSAILSGRAPRVLSQMEKEMIELAASESFEEASIKKHQLAALRNLYTRRLDVSLYTDRTSALELLGQSEVEALAGVLKKYMRIHHKVVRIECVDISNTSGNQATGSLVVAISGLIDTAWYRKFKIKTMKTPNDVAMIEEVLRRRFSHKEWDYPDLLVIDGGKAQLNRALAILRKLNLTIPTIGLAKRQEEIILLTNGTLGTIRLPLTSPALHLLQRLRDEAHRFALSYHRKLRNREAFATMSST